MAAASNSVVSSDTADDGNDELVLEEHIDLSVSDHVTCVHITSPRGGGGAHAHNCSSNNEVTVIRYEVCSLLLEVTRVNSSLILL